MPRKDLVYNLSLNIHPSTLSYIVLRKGPVYFYIHHYTICIAIYHCTYYCNLLSYAKILFPFISSYPSLLSSFP